jgi:hypothetical protein
VIAGDATRVGRLRLDGPERGDAAAVSRAGRLVEGAGLRPSGLPAQAVLCVRRLADPRPGLVRLDAGGIRPPPAWDAAVRDALEAALRGAARPAAGAVPAGANAVVFADHGEVLACLAADWLSGGAATHWWWRELAGPAPGRDGVVRAWAERPEYVPAAVELLAARGAAARFAAALEPREAAALAQAAARAAGLGPGVAAAAALVAGAPAEVAAPPPPAPPPWRHAAPEAAPPLAPAAALLVGVTLAIRRAPAAARDAAFAPAARTWAQAAVTAAPTRGSRAPTMPADAAPVGPPAARVPPRADAPAPPPPPAEREAPAPPATPSPRRTPELRAAPDPPPAPPAAHVAAAAAANPPPAPPSAPSAAPEPTAESPSPPSAPGAIGDELAAVAEPAPEPRPAAEPAPPPPVPECVDTALGGLFFLVALCQHLGLVADFSAPADPGAGVDPWDLVVLLGERLLDPPDADDPVWALLASLAGRDPETRPAAGVRPPRGWRVPPEWLAPFGEDERAARLRRDALRRPPARHGRRAVDRWADRVAAYADARLRLALGVDDAAGLLLRVPARVELTPAHVDVVLSLDRHPVEVRLAGLDRDPGWVPAAGRFLAFHFT